MTNLKILEARIKRSNLIDVAGKSYRSSDSLLINRLNNNNNNNVYVGIESDRGYYTVLGKDKVYFRSKSGDVDNINLSDFSKCLSQTAMSKGKQSNIEFISCDRDSEVWIKDSSTMNAIWNVVLFLIG